MAVRFSKIYGLLLCVLLITSSARGQFILIPEVQPGGVVIKQQLLSLVINNLSGTTKRAILLITVTDRISSQVLLEANSSILVLSAGAKRVTYNELSPLNYAVATIGFSADRQFNQPLPVGEYLACYHLVNADNKRETLTSECVRIMAEPLSPPLLIQPENKTMVMEPRPVLTWTPPAPVYMFNALSYDIIVSPVYDKQSPEEALQRNIPAMTTISLNNSIAYPSSYTNLETGKTYAWQVVAKDAGRFGGKSEVWTFTVMPDSVVQIITNATYIKLVKQSPQTTVVHQGVIKSEYFNYLADSVVSCTVQRANGRDAKGKQSVSFELRVKAGQNFLQYNLNGKLRLDENEVYELKLINSRKEEWIMKFIPRKYF